MTEAVTLLANVSPSLVLQKTAHPSLLPTVATRKKGGEAVIIAISQRRLPP